MRSDSTKSENPSPTAPPHHKETCSPVPRNQGCLEVWFERESLVFEGEKVQKVPTGVKHPPTIDKERKG